MARLRVRFEWLTGLKQPIFPNVRLVGSWDRHGRYADEKRIVAMKKITAPDGCPAWRADVRLDDAQRGWTFRWGVIALPSKIGRPNKFGIPPGARSA